MNKVTSFIITLMLWMAWGISTGYAGVNAMQPKFWPVWIVTLLMCVFYGNKHHWEKKE